jgi:uncharacterized coiled-coil protein SlyX
MSSGKEKSQVPDKTTDEKLIGTIDKLADMVHALTHNVVKLDATLSAMSEKIDALIEKLEKQA